MRISSVATSVLLMMLSLAILGGQPLTAAPTVINFEQFTGMPFENPAPVPAESRLYDQLLDSAGVLFTSGSSFVSVLNMGPDHATSGVNTIAGTTPAGELTYDRSNPVVISFFEPGNASAEAVVNFVSIRADLWASLQPITLNAYGLNGNLIGSMTTTDMDGATLQISAPGIHSVELLGTGNVAGVAWDDLTFDTGEVTPPVCAIPAPASAMLVMCGLATIRAIRRRR